MTLQEILLYIKSRYDVGATDSEILEHTNEVYRDLTKPFTLDVIEEDTSLATATDQAIYTLGEDSRRIREVHIVDGLGDRRRLHSVRPQAILYPRLEGMPRRWYVAGMDSSTDVRQQFGLDPVPTVSEDALDLIVQYEPEPESLVNDTDLPLYIPEELHYLIAWGTISILAGREENYNVSQHWQARYTNHFNEVLMTHSRAGKLNFPESARQVTSQ